jgi:hypothetical protein
MPGSYFWARTSENSISETVWKFRRGPKQELRGRREGAKGAIYVPLPLQRLTIQTPQAIFQTVSPRTPVNKRLLVCLRAFR